MTPDDMIHELAGSLRDVINETPESVDEAPEEFYQDLAARLVLKLARNRLTVAPAIDVSSGKAAMRIFDILTKWLEERPGRSYDTGSESGKFGLLMKEAGKTQAFLRGENVQDVYGQAAQAISFNGGSIDEEELQATAQEEA